MSISQRGQIITFYSFKGGTGRTMALANVACALVQRQGRESGKGVLMIDWDLEAPGLHRYFRSRKSSWRSGGVSPEDSADATKPGLIDLFHELNDDLDRRLMSPDKYSEESGIWTLGSEKLARAIVNSVDLQRFITPTTLDGLSLLKAGRFDPKAPNEYPERVNKFNWEALYNKNPHLIRVFAEVLADRYAFVLVDSRTGVTDISGICTTLLPEKLVVVFTPNAQSLQGGLELIRRATDYRQASPDLRPLMVFPLVSRVEANEPDLRHNWRFGNPQDDSVGYQTEFEMLLSDIYGDREVKLNKYFDEIQIQHIPRYAYGEEIAVLAEKISDKFSLRRSYQIFASKLVESRSPWEGEINDVYSPEDSATRFFDWLRNKLGSRAAKRKIRTVLLTSLVLIAALVSAFLYYLLQNNRRIKTTLEEEQQKSVRLQQQLSDLQHPKAPSGQPLSGKIEEVRLLKSSGQDTQIFIRLSIRNYGPPTKVYTYSLQITPTYSTGFDMKRTPIELKENQTLPKEGGVGRINIRPQDSIIRITDHAINTNGIVSGWLRFNVPSLGQEDGLLWKAGTRYIVAFNDESNTTYKTTYEMGF